MCMDFSEIQKLIVANADRYSKKHGIEIDLEWLLLKLVEENGEFANALLIYSNKCRKEKMVSPDQAKADLSKELVDVLTTLILLGDKLDIDILESLNKHVLEKGKRHLESQSE